MSVRQIANDGSNKQALLEAVDARTKLAGSNKLEMLLFTLGTGETFGINVFKVREVTQTPAITPTPYAPPGVEGVISLRGSIIPAISLARLLRLPNAPQERGQTMIVTEYCRHTQGFLVHDVSHIIRVDWEDVKAPQAMLTGQEGTVTAVTRAPDGSLVSILDVEQILVDALGEEPVPDLTPVQTAREHSVFFADDSGVARRKIVSVLDRLGVKHQQANNGLEAWEKLQALAARAGQDGVALRDQISLILTDAEMPEMDGYVLAKKVKSDNRFEGIPVVMHSSLSSQANRNMGRSVGVDAYVGKFDPVVLADTLRPLLDAGSHGSAA